MICVRSFCTNASSRIMAFSMSSPSTQVTADAKRHDHFYLESLVFEVMALTV